MAWIFRGGLVACTLLLVWGIAQSLSGPRSCGDRLESALVAAWEDAWDALTAAPGGGGPLPPARTLVRSEQGLRLMRRLESIGRDAFEDAELVEPSASRARAWLNLFLLVYEDAVAHGGTGSARSVLQIDRIEESEEALLFELRAASGEVSLSITVEASCHDGHLSWVRVR